MSPQLTTDVSTIPHYLHRQWTNWGGNQSATPAHTFCPRSEGEVAALVRFALKENWTVRVVGAGHSFTPLVQTGGILLDLRNLSGITATDSARKRVRALGGTPISEFGDPLWNAGLSLSNQGDIDKQSIAGALSTGTHGSGITLGSFSSTLRSARLVNGLGEIIEIDEENIEELNAAQVALGTLGVLTEVELQVSPRYCLAEDVTYPTWQETISTLDEDLKSNRHYSFLWCQDEVSASLYDLPTPAGESMVNRSYTKRYNVIDEDKISEAAPDGQRRDRAYRIYTDGFMTKPFHELEYYVSASHAKEAVEALQRLIRTKHSDQKYPIEVRWIKADDGLLSPFHKRDSVSLSVSGAPGTEYWPYLRDVDALLQDYDARAHWGKIHFLNRERVEALYPRFPDFASIRSNYDPKGIFLNDHTRSLLI